MFVLLIIGVVLSANVPEYLAIVANDNPEPYIDYFTKVGLSHLKLHYPKDDVLEVGFTDIFSSEVYWTRAKPWHITCLYIGQNLSKLDTPYYKQFKAGVNFVIQSRIVVFVPERLVLAPVLIDRSKILIENEFPHTTLYRKNWPAVDSNNVLSALFGEEGYIVHCVIATLQFWSGLMDTHINLRISRFWGKWLMFTFQYYLTISQHYVPQHRLYIDILLMDTNNFLQSLPKVELHAHLNGCARLSTLKEFYVEDNGDTKENPLEVCDSIEKAFVIFRQVHQLVNSLQRIRRITREVLEDFQKDNVIYLELRTTPKSDKDFTQEDYINAILEEFKTFESSNNMKVRLLVSIDRARGLTYAQETLSVLENVNLKPYIVGVDISGNPAVKIDLEQYNDVFAQVKALGLKLTVHLGELNLDHQYDEIDYFLNLGVDRVGHLCFYRKEHLQKLKEKNIPVEVCITSNMITLKIKAEQHHLKDLIEAGVNIIPCTDDTLFNITLTRELQIIQEAFKLSDEQIQRIEKNALNYIFGQI